MTSLRQKLSYYRSRWLGARQRFTAIYRANIWNDDESVSGHGSRADSLAVAETLAALDLVVERYGIRSLIDLPCGDMNWIGSFLQGRPEIAYTGHDIVEELIEANRQRFPQLQFAPLDIIREVPAAADLILCKDLVNHLTNGEIVLALRNMAASGSRWLLITSNAGCANRALPRWRMATSRAVDLCAPPYNLPQPEWATGYLALWRLDVLAPVLARLG